MNKEDFIKQISKSTSITQKDTREVVSAMLDLIRESLSRGEDVKFTGFGKFSVKTRNERTMVNPLTKSKIKIPKTKIATFKAGKELKLGIG